MGDNRAGIQVTATVKTHCEEMWYSLGKKEKIYEIINKLFNDNHRNIA